MKNNRNRQVILKSRPADIPQADNFEIIGFDVPDMRDGQCWCTTFISRRTRDARLG